MPTRGILNVKKCTNEYQTSRGITKKFCCFGGCTTFVYQNGVCKKHLKKTKDKRCQFEWQTCRRGKKFYNAEQKDALSNRTAGPWASSELNQVLLQSQHYCYIRLYQIIHYALFFCKLILATDLALQQSFIWVPIQLMFIYFTLTYTQYTH